MTTSKVGSATAGCTWPGPAPNHPRPSRPDEKLLAKVEEALALLTRLTPTECVLAPDA